MHQFWPVYIRAVSSWDIGIRLLSNRHELMFSLGTSVQQAACHMGCPN